MKDKNKKKHLEADQATTHSNGKQKHGDLPAPVLGNAEILHLGKDCDYEKELRRLQVELVKLQEIGRASCRERV